MKGNVKPGGELIFSVLLFVLGVTIIVFSLEIGFGEFTKPGPGLFPFLCGLVLCLQSVSLHLFRQKKQERENPFSHEDAIGKFILLVASFALWVILIPWVGWLPLTFLVTLAVAKIMRMEDWVKPLILAATNTAFSWYVFGYLLAIDLPNGFWM